MSGIEVAGLVFGVIPIIIEILKSYRTTRDRLNAFRKHSQIVNEVQLRYRVAATNFNNDCQLLLKAVVDDAREISKMMGDPQHSGWRDPQLEARFRAFLEPNYTLFEDIITLIRDVLRKTQEDLQGCFEQPPGPGSQHITAQRLYLAFNISRKENKYRRWLDTLDSWNKKLSKLRKQRCKLQKQCYVQSSCLVRKAVPQEYTDIQVASHRLHKSLQESWSCTNDAHTKHQAKLSLEATAEHGSVRLDIVIACRKRYAGSNQVEPPSDVPIWLQVKTLTAHKPVEKSTMPSATIVTTLMASARTTSHTKYDSTSESVTNIAKRKLASQSFDPDVDYDDTCSKLCKGKGPKLPSTSSDQSSHSFVTLDLRATDSICGHLSRSCSSTPGYADSCLGYLEYLEATFSSRLIFYNASKSSVAHKTQPTADVGALPIISLLSSLRTFHQLTLAHHLAVATLQYQSTSWLAPDWGLQDISYFDKSTIRTPDELSEQLQSLHLSTQFPGTNSSDVCGVAQERKDLKDDYGIRNLPLAKLGVALLEIGSQAEINSLSSASAPHDVIRARKVLREPPSSIQHLGKRYLKIAQKCIDCDFSCGDDLSDENLRSAVYTDVVCGLESMIVDWKRFLDIK